MNTIILYSTVENNKNNNLLAPFRLDVTSGDCRDYKQLSRIFSINSDKKYGNAHKTHGLKSPGRFIKY